MSTSFSDFFSSVSSRKQNYSVQKKVFSNFWAIVLHLSPLFFKHCYFLQFILRSLPLPVYATSCFCGPLFSNSSNLYLIRMHYWKLKSTIAHIRTRVTYYLWFLFPLTILPRKKLRVRHAYLLLLIRFDIPNAVLKLL